MRNLLLNILFLVFISSCGDSKKFNSEINHDDDFLRQSEACKSVDLYKTPLSKENSLSIFKCFNWNKQLPDLYSTIESFPVLKWNKLVAPLNDIFFKDSKRRDQFLEIISDLKENNGFNNLNNFVVKFFNEKDFYNFILRVTSTLNDNRTEIVDILNKHGIDFVNIIHGLELYENIAKTINTEKFIFRMSFEKFRSNPENYNSLIKSIDEAAKFLINNDLNNYSNVLANIVMQKKDVWILNLISNGLTSENLKQNLLFIEERGIGENLRELQKSYKNKINCKEVNNEKMIFKINEEVDSKFSLLLNNDFEGFWEEMIDAEIKLEMAKNLCQNNNFNLFSDLHSQTIDLVSKDINLKFLSKVINIFSTPDLLFNFVNSDFFKITGNLLFNLNTDDEFLFSNLHKVLSKLDMNSLVNFDKFVRELNEPKIKSILDLIARIWISLENNEKEFLVNLIKYHTEEDINFYQIISYYKKLLKIDKEINQVFKKRLFSNLEETKNTLDTVNELMLKLQQENIKSDLIKLLSEEYLIKLFKLFNTNSNVLSIQLEAKPIYQLSLDFFQTNDLQYQCYKDLERKGIESQVRMIIEFPESCKNIEGKFLINLFKDLSEFNNNFKQKYGIDFVSSDGFLSSKMNSEVVGLVFEANRAFKKHGLINNSLGELVFKLKEFYLDPLVKEVIRNSNKLIYNVNQKSSDFIKSISKTVINLFKDAKNNGSILPLISITGNGEISSFEYNCSKIENKLFINGCMDKEYIRLRLHNIIDLLAEETDSDYQIYEGIIDLFRKSSGITIPARRKNSRDFQLKISEMGEMVLRLSTNNPIDVDYKNKEKSELMKLTVLDRIEAVIKDIGFLDNFYGAYFMNTVAESKDYVHKVKSLKKNLKLLESTGGMFRKLKIFPESTEYQLENILNTYDGLVEGGELGYADHLQAALTLVSTTSPIKNQDFQPYRIPTIKKVEGHKGKILTNIAELRGFTHLSELYRQAANSIGSNRINEEIKLLDKKFLKIVSEEKLKKFIGSEFFKDHNSKKNLKKLVDVILNMDNKTRSMFTSIIWDILIIGHEIFEENEMDQILNGITGINELISNILDTNIFNQKKLLKNIAFAINNLKLKSYDLKNKKIIKSNLISIFQEQDFIKNINLIIAETGINNFLVSLENYQDANFDILKYMTAIDEIVSISRNDFKFWEDLLIYNSNNYLTKIINIGMAPNSNNSCKFEEYLDKILVREDLKLSKFIEEIASSVEFVENK